MDGLQVLQLHGWLMWASMGFLFPLGTLLIRQSRKLKNAGSNPKAKLFLHSHIFVQVLSLVLAVIGIVVPIVKLGPNWNFTHQRLGLALLIIAGLVAIIGPLRPNKGTPNRPIWFTFHWGLGTALLFLGIVDCYIGINAYQHITKLSLRTLNIVFSIQVSIMALLWVLQDRWNYIWSGAENTTQSNAGKVAQAGDEASDEAV